MGRAGQGRAGQGRAGQGRAGQGVRGVTPASEAGWASADRSCKCRQHSAAGVGSSSSSALLHGSHQCRGASPGSRWRQRLGLPRPAGAAARCSSCSAAAAPASGP
jgi:hypothetical protein